MAKKRKTNKKILFLAIWKSRWYILKYYPKMIYMANHPEKYTEDERYEYTLKLINFLLKACDVKTSVYGEENIPAEDGFLVCSNHQEKFDPLVIWKVFPRRIGVVVNDTACHRPFIREVCLLIRSLKLFQNDMHSMVDVITRLTAELTNKRNYMIFPEGWYEEDPFTLS
ncbi:MAG: 1-acyl-sn-glycerol-3-phosphate acyltransferase, partial [Treponema sp.]|nr:1-acyl-sn-glycerol-3-phosphate acyltransferase [Treponema sp.]